MSLIKKIKQFINGSWQEFSLNSSTLDNVVTLNGNEEITGTKTFTGDVYVNGGGTMLLADGTAHFCGRLFVNEDIATFGNLLIGEPTNPTKLVNTNEEIEELIINLPNKSGTLLTNVNLVDSSINEIKVDMDGYDEWTTSIGGGWVSVKNSGIWTVIYTDHIQIENDENMWALGYPTEAGILATQEWVQANTICSSTIDQEFFNSLY